MNYTTIQSIQHIVKTVRNLSEETIPRASIPDIQYFEKLTAIDNPSDLPLQELPFKVYLITGTAGSGKSSCIQTLYENLNCTITGATRMASQNVFHKLNAAYICKHVNTIYYEFGFRGHHVQLPSGRYVHPIAEETISNFQKRDILYYWDVIKDITINSFKKDEKERKTILHKLQLASINTEKPIHRLLKILHTSMPNFTKSNIIVIDEAGLLSRHLLTTAVYSWWLFNAQYKTTFYNECHPPVFVCVGSPTQTDSMESMFEHSKQKHTIFSSENILSYLICNKAINKYINLEHNWSIFINNKRCTEFEFGTLLKTLEFGLPITQELIQYVDQFVVCKSYIMDPSNLQGWTRLFTSHDEVQAYMIKLHSHLRTKEKSKFVVFSLPMYTYVRMLKFEEYKTITGQPDLKLEHWLEKNMARISNYSQFKDHDITKTTFPIPLDETTTVSNMEITYVLNSSVSITNKLKKYVIGYDGTFEEFLTILMDDTFLKKHSDENRVENTYRFLSTLLYNGMIAFYNYLSSVDQSLVDPIYEKLANISSGDIPQELTSMAQCTDWILHSKPEECFQFDAIHVDETEPEDVLFDAVSEKSIDFFYINYNFTRHVKSHEIYEQYTDLKLLFMARYSILAQTFGDSFTKSPFVSYVNNVTTDGCEICSHNLAYGLISYATQTENYIIKGYTYVNIPAFEEEILKRKSSNELNKCILQSCIPYMVLKDSMNFVSVMNFNISDFVDTVSDKELHISTSVDYGLSSKLAMTIARSQGLGLDKVAICFSENKLKLNSVYVAMSRVTSSHFLRLNINPLRKEYDDNQSICSNILSALRNRNIKTVY